MKEKRAIGTARIFLGRWEMVDGGWMGILWKVSGGKGEMYGFLANYCGDNLHGEWWPCLLVIAEEMVLIHGFVVDEELLCGGCNMVVSLLRGFGRRINNQQGDRSPETWIASRIRIRNPVSF